MPQFTEHLYTAPDGIRTYYRRYAASGNVEKAPVVCMHGLTRNSRDFEEVAPALSAMGHSVIAIDVRGRGQSDYDPQPERYNPGTYVGDVLGLLAEVGWSKFIALGTSMGGLMTMILASQKPQMLIGAILNDIGPEINPVGLARIQGYVGGAGPFANWEEATEAVRMINGVAFPKQTENAFWLAFAKRVCRETDTGQVILDYDKAISQPVKDGDVAPPDLWPLFEALKGTPLLLVRGEITDLLTMACVEEMSRRHGDMRLTNVPDVGHAPLLTEPMAREAIEQFLNAL